MEFTLSAGQLLQSGLQVYTYKSRAAGLRAVVLREQGPGLWSLRVRAARITLPPITNFNVTIELTPGDDTFSYQARLLVKGGGRRYVGTPATTTMTVVSSPPTTTTLPSSALLGTVPDGLDVVAVEVDHEGTVVVRMVLRPEARWPVVAPARSAAS